MEWLLCELSKAEDESELYRSAQYWQSRFEFEEPWDEDDFFTVFYALSITPGLLHEREIQIFFDNLIDTVLDEHANAHALFSFMFRGLAGAMSKIYLVTSKEIVNFIKVLVTYFFKGSITSDKIIQLPQNNYTIQEFFNMYEPILPHNIHVAGFTLEIEGKLWPFVWQNFTRILNPSDPNDFLLRIQSKPEHIVSVGKWLTKLNIDQICQVCYKLPVKSENMYAVLRFLKDWNPISSFHQACRDDFIRSVPLIFAQIVMAHKACWWDSDTLACATCKINWRHFLPQWRCTAMWCDGDGQHQQNRCFRFLQPGTLFCKQHLEEKKDDETDEKRYVVAKPYCISNIPGREIITSDMYRQEPDPHGDAIVRYGLTQRVVTSLGIFSHRRDTWKPDGFYLPVTRYESLYYSTQDETQKTESRRYCGKFFFFEPESPYFLHLDKCLFFATKVEALIKLKEQYDLLLGIRNMMDAKQFVLDLQKQSSLFNPQNNTDWFNFHFMTPIFDFRDTRNAEGNINIPILYPSETITRDGSFIPSGQGVGDFDDLDQEICKMARVLGYDVLIFQHEIGNYDCVTEFLITNPAKEILYVMEHVPTTLYLQQANNVYPKIWFPKQNGIVRVLDNKVQEIELGDNWDTLSFLFPFPMFPTLPLSSLPQAMDSKSQAPRFVHIKRPFYNHFKERRSTKTEPPEEEEEFEKFL